MSFHANAGRIRVTDEDGLEKLDTDDALFHGVPPGISGMVSIAEVRLSNGAVINDIRTWNLGACHPACTHVIGAVHMSGTVGGAIGFDRWTTYMGGDLIWLLNSPPKLANGNYGRSPSDLISYSFYCSGGQVYMAQQRVLLGGPNQNTAVYPAHDISYRLKPGVFT